MTLFLILAAALVLLVIGVVGFALWRQQPNVDEPGLVEKNIAIAKERLAALDATHTGDMSSPEYLEERSRIEAQLARELDPEKQARQSRGWDLALIAVLLLVVPASTAWLYTRIGNPAAISFSPQIAQADPEQPSLPELVSGLEQRLAQTPDDVTGWRMLGRTRLAMNDFDAAGDAFSRALELEADDVDTITNLAEARAMNAGGDLSDVVALLERAHQLNADHEQTLWLLGVARQQTERHEEALSLFARLRAMVGARGDANAIATIDQYASRSRLAIGQAATVVAPSANTSSETLGATDETGVSVTVAVSLGEAASTALAPETPVFVFARAAEGPPMPLAVQRLSVGELPATVTLDESMAMIAGMTIANFPDLIVGARASLSGQPVARSGDWSQEVPARVGSDAAALPVELVIDAQIP